MPARLFPLALVAFVALLLSAPCALADPVAWSYSGEVRTDRHTLDHTSLSPVWERRADEWATNHDLRLEFEGLSGEGSGSADVAAFRIRSLASDPAPSGNFFSADKHTFTLTFGLTDKASGASGSLAFQGKLTSGFIDFGSAKATGAFSGPASQSVQLGEHIYKVTVSPFAYDAKHTPPPSPRVGPSQDVQVSVSVSDVPEPSALALAGLGLPALLTLARSRRGGLARGGAAAAPV